MKHIFGKLLTAVMVMGLLMGGYGTMKAEAGKNDGTEKLNYLVVEKPYLEASEEQNIVASVGDGDITITEAILSYQNTDTGKSYQKKVNQIAEDALLFNLKFDDSKEKGAYCLTGISYIADGKNHEIDLTELENNAVFGVNKEVNAEADAYVAEDEAVEAALETAVVTIDEEGNQSSELSIAEALENVTEQVPVKARTYGADQEEKTGSGFVVVLDPGHGGSDPGAVRTINGVTYYERNIVLKIAEYCKAELEKTPGIEVYLTRTDNTSKLMDRKERTDYAVSKGADVIVSLHINSTGSQTTTASGSLVYCPNKDTESGELSQELASMILEKLEQLGLQNRGNVVDEGLGMILYPKQYGIPGILVEHAFINNPNDVTNHLSTDEQLKQLGIADAHGILEYFNTSVSGYYSAIFDAKYYADTYPDLKAAFGNNNQQLLNHFINYGMTEGRRGSAEFDVQSYRNQYVDLRRAFGNDLKSYYLHYITTGKQERRLGAGCDKLQNAVTVYKGVDYKDVYDYEYYINANVDIKRLMAGDDVAVLSHFVEYGMKEGRQGKKTFSVHSYRNEYSDLRRAFGSDLKAYYMHYISNGKSEGRNATGCITLKNPVTVYDGVDYKDVYSYEYYVNTYSDVAKSYRGDDAGALKHFVTTGMKKGLRGSEKFDVASYKNQYADLRKAFGKDFKSYYLHYMDYGKAEGRAGTGCTTVQGATTVYNGVDYKTVYDYGFYTSAYADIKNAFGNDDEAVLAHFVNYGMTEGRQGNEGFHVQGYRSKYGDLNAAFGNDWRSYYNHYMNYGIGEGRTSK